MVKIKMDDNIAVLTMDDGENRFYPASVEAHHDAMDRMEADDSVRALVITGAHPKYFCNGLHLEKLIKLAPMELYEFTPRFSLLLERWSVFPKPVVAAINGHAFAGGAMLAACADFRVMNVERGWLCTPEVDIMLPFWPGMIEIFKCALPPNVWRTMALTGKRFTATELNETRFLDAAVPPGEVLPKAMEIARMAATKNPDAFREIKKRMKAHLVKTMREEDPKYFPPPPAA